ncbi:MAG: hexokinase, partial [Treponema sp.]|nr:hexokinase [Treponema sp.]
MDTRQNVQNFLTRHEFSTDVADGLHERILADMKSGLDGKSSDQAMIQAGSAVMHEIQEGSTAIVIDAGGTNFRSCLVTKNRTGISLSQFEKTFMPGSDRNVSKKEFFSAIASNIARLKDASDRIAFCFSYAMEITDDGDGRILKFSKEVKAQDAVGSLLGKELILELERQRWKKIQKVSVLNDTTALLLADLSATESDMMRSHVAFILGTGMNSAYVHGGRIVVTECGMFNGVQQSDFDRIVDAGTAHAGQSVLEKMCSGVYLGEIVHAMIKTACTEGLFSNAFCSAAKDIE